MDLLGITESWLHVEGSEVTIGELWPNGYRLLHSPRSAGRGGGVGLLSSKVLALKQGSLSILLHRLNALMSLLLLVRV